MGSLSVTGSGCYIINTQEIPVEGMHDRKKVCGPGLSGKVLWTRWICGGWVRGDNWRMDGIQGNPDSNADCLGRVNVWCWEMDRSRG